jgi:chemotaxis protein CheD
MIPAEDTANEQAPILHVRIGELRTGTSGILKATLGSCVAIALIDQRTGVCGLAHCFLPFAPEGCAGTDARYADRAAANLLRQVAPDPAEKRKLRAFLAGGGRLLSQEASSRLQVGQLNVRAARAGLAELGIRFTEIEIGGEAGCNAILDCDTFTFTCEKIGHSPMDIQE